MSKHFMTEDRSLLTNSSVWISRSRNAIDAMTDFMQYSYREEMARAMSCGSDYDDYEDYEDYDDYDYER